LKINAIHTHHARILYDMGAEFAGLRFATMDHLLIQVDTDRHHGLRRGLRKMSRVIAS
jgi:hypothetical protein